MSERSANAGSKLELYRHIHESNESYGTGSRHFEYVRFLCVFCGFNNLLDFGCGKGVLADELTGSGAGTCHKYDPAMRDYNVLPEGRFDAVVNTDVLEHVPEDELPAILDRFKTLSSNAVIIPHLEKAREILPSGENAHCTIKTPDEWAAVFRSHYKHVLRLQHDSRRHALFLCTDDAVENPDALDLATQHIADRLADSNAMQVKLDDPLSHRCKSAVKLLLGAKNIRRFHRIRRRFR